MHLNIHSFANYISSAHLIVRSCQFCDLTILPFRLALFADLSKCKTGEPVELTVLMETPCEKI